MVKLFEDAQKKNKTLAIWTKTKVEKMALITTVWDNFKNILNNHQFLISKQVLNFF